MNGKLRIVELTERDAMEHCRSEGWLLPEPSKSGDDLNAYWAFVGQKILGIMYGRKEKFGILLLGLLSNLPKEVFFNIFKEEIYTWKQMGIVVESRIEGWALGRNDMMLPCPIGKVLRAI